MKNQFWAVVWAGLWIKGSGPIMSNFWGPFSHFFEVKLYLFYKKLKKKIFWPQKSEKKTRAKNLRVNTWRLGSDICSLICGCNGQWKYLIFWTLKELLYPSMSRNLKKDNLSKILIFQQFCFRLLTFIKVGILTLLCPYGLVKINTVSANVNNTIPLLISNN